MVITFTDIRSNIGYIAIALYDDASQWTEEPRYEMHWEKENMEDDRFTATVPDIPYGKYAIAVLDDENRDLEMQYLLGLPREGFGMSNNPSFVSLKKPTFEDAAFLFDAPAVRFEIKINYINKNKKIRED